LFSEDGKRLNIHPAVKPTELLEYLVRLVAPKGATVLDPFMGSGSTGKAVMFENRERNAAYKFIGVELSEEYIPIAEARIKFAEGFELDEKIEKSQKSIGKSVEKSQKSHERMFEKWGFDIL
jgi:DNA modification methylase